MKLRFEKEFVLSLEKKIHFIALDSPNAAQAFQKGILQSCKALLEMPYKHRKSIYHDDQNIRDLVYKGYTVVYAIEEEFISVLALINQEYYHPKEQL
ncbi:type II toxin-antitoxin system RelE/ParE family toxin [Sulfurospirillum oryzae]|uniref:type II toxin-antitoxin system RelE/ParE family toxin n=1 Tax=Sulfurospirillum oryzae TaxID=2976535 RepID=UPI0021E816AB|nr:type II toxin-antitoxin system RelE/ParE family toxin [Sulfurospirillum oryzae]